MFGLGHKTGLGLPEQAGLIPTREIKRKRLKEPWVGGDSLITAIGQGLNLTTPLQLAVMSARLASGAAVVPTLFQPETPPLFDLLPVKRSHLEFIHKTMFDTIEGGTAFGARRVGVPLGGKTGTSQVISKNHGDVKSYSGIVREERPHALFVGFGPIPNPRVAISVVVEHGGFGGAVAAPIGTKVLEASLKSLGVIP
jgi:penicillin-binding protein 2